MDSDLFRKQYDFELEQRNAIASATNIPIVAITVVASATSAVLLDFQYSASPLTFIFLGFAFLTLVSIVSSVYFLFRSFWNYEYQKLPGSSALKQHHDDLLAWHSANGLPSKEAKASTTEDFSQYINSRLAEASDWNGQNNIIRGNYLHMATAAVAISIASLIPGGLSYIYNKTTAEEKTHKVKITEFINPAHQEVQMSNQSSSDKNKLVAAPSPPPTSAAKPSGPPNAVFKGNTAIPKPSANNLTNK